MDSQGFVFDENDIKVIEMPVTIGKDEYVLREATGEAARLWRNEILKATEYNTDTESTSMRDVASTDTFLVSQCLFKKGSPEKVSIVTIRSWPQRISKKLFEWVKEVSELSEEDTEENLRKQIAKMQKKLDKKLKGQGDSAKNVQETTTVGSV